MPKDLKRTYVSKVMLLGATMMLTSVGILPINAYANSTGSTEPLPVVAKTQQAKYALKGTVEDPLGPIAGANVLEKGTTNGTITDADGNFTLDVSPNSTLIISYIGYKEQQIPVNNKKQITVKMVEDSEALEEVVVVGYGTQKKVNLSGSVSSINVAELTESRPITNVSHALAGLAAGVQVSSSNNQPGNDNASIKVRGQGTLNTSSPLIIIDGVEAGINTVNPSDIESMTVLKDAASASIYGSRAANGVILITTKKGKAGSLRIDYNGYVSFESIRKTLTPVSNYADYMEYINQGYANSNMAKPFAEGAGSAIEAWRNDNGQNPLLYPNTDWIDATFKSSVANNHVVSMSGGSEKIRFYTSFGYMNNPGVMENAGYEKYSGRVNLDADVKQWLTVGIQANGYLSNMEPGAKYKDSGTNVDNVFTYASATTPGMVFRAPDGRYGAMNNPEDAAQSAANNPLKSLNSVAGNHRKNNLRARFYGTLKPIKGLSITASYSYEFVDELRETKPVFLDGWNFQTETVTQSGTGKSSVSNTNWNISRNFGDVVAKYENKFFSNRLDLTVMGGASQEQYQSKNFGATRYDLIDMNLGVINAATGESSSSGSSSEWTMRSFFGRVNLGWEDKYLLEGNLRVDQSSRFLSHNRTGYFPSASAAWRIDQENFMENLRDRGLSNLKLRASYGSLGNNSVGNYDALSVYSTSNYVTNNSLAMGLAQAAIANANLTWESTYITDIGVDFGTLNNRLTGTVDYFNKRTKDILINLPAPNVHGTASIPKMNSATVTNKGVEVTLSWNDKIGDVTYNIGGNFTYVKNNVDKYKGEDRTISGANLIQEGYSINSQYVLKVDRIIQTEEDLAIVEQMIANNPNVFKAYYGSKKPELGDFLYQDTNGRDEHGKLTGKPDGIIDDDDRVVVSDGPNPKYMYGFNLGAQWKGFDFSMLMQGQAGIKVLWKQDFINTPQVRIGYQLNKEQIEGSWIPGRTDASSPRLLQYSDTRNTLNSDYYLENKAFFKIRNIQLGYTIPQKWTKKAQIERVRIYGSLENFFTFTKYKGLDPEVSGLAYPSMKEAVIGLNVTF